MQISDYKINVSLKIRIHKKAVLFCLIVIVFFCSLLNAQLSGTSINKPELPHCTFGFEKTILREIEMKDARTTIEYWMSELGKNVAMKISGYIIDDFNSFITRINSGEIDVAAISPVSYLNNRKKLNLVPGYAPLIGGKKTRKYLLIVHSDSAISEIKDLKGKKIAVLKENVVGRVFLDILLLRSVKKEANSFFSSISEKEKFPQVILSVFFGQMDACIATELSLKTMIELNPQIGKRLKVLAESPEVISMISFFNQSYNAELREKVLTGILTLSDIIYGKQILMSLKVDRFVPAMESDLESLDKLLKEYKRLKGSD